VSHLILFYSTVSQQCFILEDSNDVDDKCALNIIIFIEFHLQFSPFFEEFDVCRLAVSVKTEEIFGNICIYAKLLLPH
jgi:hypothetical protein